MEQELAYSFHLGSDKNKSKVAKKTAKGNVSGSTSFSNNAIQNANDLSKANKHNLRDYDNKSKVAMIRDRHIEFKLKKNQKVIRMVAIKQYKNFLAKPEGKLRLGLVTHTTSKKKHK